MSNSYKGTTHLAYLVVAAIIEHNLDNKVIERLLNENYGQDAEEIKQAIVRLQKSLIRRSMQWI